MAITDELKAGLASLGIGWIEPQDRRNKAGAFMLNRGCKMGVPIDPGEVQSMLIEFCDIYVRDLEQRSEAYRKLVEDALNVRPAPPIVIPSSLPRTSCNRHSDCRAADESAKAKGATFGASHCHDECCEDCFGC